MFRHDGWSENFFIEDLAVDTIIGLNALARGSNAVKLSFRIIEPNGVSLIERLLQTAIKMEFVNFKDALYVMQIDFVGYDQDGKPTAIVGHTKYIPFLITGIGFKVTERGSEYAISAVPFNHQALTQIRLTAPMNMSITASTVGEYFTDTSILEKNSDNEGREDSSDTDKTESDNSRSVMAAINKFEKMKLHKDTKI